MKGLSKVLILVLLLIPFEVGARKVKITTIPHEASIFIDNQFVGNGIMECIVKQRPVVLRIEHEGYITHETKIMPYDKRNAISISLKPDRFFMNSTSSGLVNKFMTIVVDPQYYNIDSDGSINLEKAWRMLHNIILNYFDEFAASDYYAGYIQTPWVHKDFGTRTSRVRVTIRDISNIHQPAFQIKISCEVANTVQASKEHFEETNRIPKDLHPMIEELQTRVGKIAKQF